MTEARYETQNMPSEMADAFLCSFRRDISIDFEIDREWVEGDLEYLVVHDVDAEIISECEDLEARLEIFYKCTG